MGWTHTDQVNSQILKEKTKPSRLPQDLQESHLEASSGIPRPTWDFLRDPKAIPTLRSGAALTLTDVGVPQVSLGVLEVEGLALLTVAAHGVVLAVITHSPAGVPRCHVHCHVKVALAGVAIAVALCDKDRKQSESSAASATPQKTNSSVNKRTKTERRVRVLGEGQLCRKDTPVSTRHEGFYTQVTACIAHGTQLCILLQLTFACVTIATFSGAPG